MATGLIALLDDVVAIAKLAAASLDDVASQTAKASVKAAGVVIDDTAVTPTYVVGFSPSRELPIIGRIALGSLRNKLVFLLPVCLLLGYFAAWIITPLLMIGGAYLCFEGAEKLHRIFRAHEDEPANAIRPAIEPVQLEDRKVAGAIRTDFILSAEIMALTLAGVAASNIATQAAVLAAVGVLITVAVYGVVAVIVKADDIGLHLVRHGSGATRALGRSLVVGTPFVLEMLTVVGTAAMLWVGGSIIIHGLAELGVHGPEHFVEHAVEFIRDAVGVLPAITTWTATSFFQGVFGIAVGGVMVGSLSALRVLRSNPNGNGASH